jgi:hypothetical protein
MTQIHRVAILIPLVVSAPVVLATIFIHAMAVYGTVTFFRHERRQGRTGTVLLIDIFIAALAILVAFLAHLLEIALWACLFLACKEFQDFGSAFYHSAVNYTTLGYGDIVMSPTWRLLGPLEGANGALMFGVSTALIFAITQSLVVTRYVDLKD